MTGAQTDPVLVPAAEQAAAILYRLASPLFRRWYEKPDADDAYQHWCTLRRIAGEILKRRNASLYPQECEALIPAFKFAHDLAHDYDPGDPVPTAACHCDIAERMRDFAEITFGCEAGTI